MKTIILAVAALLAAGAAHAEDLRDLNGTYEMSDGNALHLQAGRHGSLRAELATGQAVTFARGPGQTWHSADGRLQLQVDRAENGVVRSLRLERRGG